MLNDYYALYKAASICSKRNIPLAIPILKIAKRIFFPASDIPFTCSLGENVRFPHRAIGVVIHEGAVVVKDVPAGVVVAGVPARIIGRVSDDEIGKPK